MNDNALVIGDKFIIGLNPVCGVTISIILEEREFLVGQLVGGGMLYCIYHRIYFFKSIIIWGRTGDLGGQSHIYRCL